MSVQASWFQHLSVQRSSFCFCTSRWYGVASLQTKVVFVLCYVQCVMCCCWRLNAGPEDHPVATGCCVISWFTSVFLRTLHLCFWIVWQPICRAVARAFRRQLSPRRPGFDPSSVHVRFLVCKLELGHVFPPLLFGFLLQCCVLVHPSIHPYV